MTIDELKAKHFWNVQLADKYDHLLREDEIYLTDNHTYLSIQFAIEGLESTLIDTNDLYADEFDYFFNVRINDKIQELKEYLNGEV